MKPVIRCVIPLIFLISCTTGSQFEKQQEYLKKSPEVIKVSQKWPIVTKVNLIFEAEHNRLEKYMKGMWIPGYLGADVDHFGPPIETDKKRGFTNIYDHPDLGDRFIKFVVNQKPPTSNLKETEISIDLSISNSITAFRLHTYGCWPLIGTIVRIFNGDSHTFINSSTLRYQFRFPGGKIVPGEIVVATAKTFAFWGSLSYGFGLDIPAMQVAAMDAHLSDINHRLLQKLQEAIN
jgi:hypothetical protein